jgi:hypothetical protein
MIKSILTNGAKVKFSWEYHTYKKVSRNVTGGYATHFYISNKE